MKGKVNCTCGWSWNKSDSSAKDMYICHECGRDNSNDIPKAQKGIKSPNVQAQEEYFQKRKKENKDYNKFIGNAGEEAIDFAQRFVPGFKNLPSIGSTFAVGEAEAYNQDPSVSDEFGMIPLLPAQIASAILLEAETEKQNRSEYAKNKYKGKDITKLIPEQELNNKVIDNTYVPNPKVGKIKETKSKQIPYKEKKEVNKIEIDNTRIKPIKVLKKENGGWLDSYASGGTMQEYQENYNDSKATASPDMRGDGYSNVGRNYSPAWGGQFQTGGSIPGSVGFTYARTKGIPSNGPYAKKTLASAQNGKDMYGSPIIADLKYDSSLNRTNYNPRTNQMIFGYDMPYILSQEERDKTLAHENRHAWQFANDRTNFNIAHHPEYAFQDMLKKKPEFPSTDEVFEDYHDRKRKEIEVDVNRFKANNPDLSFMSDKVIYNKFIDAEQYDNPDSVEGEAQYYQNTGERSFQNGGEMKFYQHGLDFKPKSISRDGKWLNKYEQAQNGKKQFKLKDERLQAIRPSESTFVKKPNFEAEQAKVQRTYVDQVGKQMAEEKRRKKLTKDQREREDYNARNEQTGSIQTPVEESTWDRTKAIVSNPLTAFGYAARNQSLPTRFQHGDRNTLDYAVDWVNPLQGAAALSEIPGELGRGEFLNAGLSALDAADLGVYARGARTVAKPLIKKGVQQLGNIKTSIAPELRQGLQTNGFLDMFKSKPKSEINWGNWNKEIPENPQLIKEYNAIEQKTKANGTWMKYSDGSDFNGTPEQFIQMKHPNTQKFAGGIKETEQMYKQPLYRGAHRHIVDFKNRDRNDFATFLTDSEKNAETYATSDGGVKKYFHPDIDKEVEAYGKFYPLEVDGKYQLSFPQNLPTVEGKANGNNWRFLDYDKKIDADGIRAEINRNSFEHNLGEKKQYQYDYPENFDINKNYLSTDDYANYVKNNSTGIAKIENVKDQMGYVEGIPANTVYAVDAEKVPIKSLMYNNGMFDMTNPNIYKSVLPIGLGLGAASQLEQKREGGIIKDDRGQWKYPGQITEIGSNQITMQGVPYDVLGISDEGDTKLMKPGKNYKFKGKKVTEFPMAKNGRRQEQKGLVNLDDLLNFFNYNVSEKGGWLDNY